MSFGLKKKKIEAKSALAGKSALSAAKDAGSLVSEQASDLGQKALDALHAAQDWAEPRLQDAVASAEEGYDKARKEAKRVAAPKIEAIADDYLPRLQKAMQDAAAAASSTDGLDKKAKKASKAAQKALTKQPKKNSAGKTFGWILVGALAAGAGYLLWRRTQPVEDPWAEEYWNDEASKTSPAPNRTDANLKDVQAGVKKAAGQAKEGAAKAAAVVSEKAEEVKDKLSTAAEEAKKAATSKAEELKDKAEEVKDKLEDSDGNVDVEAAKKDVKASADRASKAADDKLGEVRKELKDVADDAKDAGKHAKDAVKAKVEDIKKD
ncbi:MAG: hypothetical protein Q4P36_06200 [Bowdeniella nasicola]|nr:hypothetical protein [Bowdeniella nasicola]